MLYKCIWEVANCYIPYITKCIDIYRSKCSYWTTIVGYCSIFNFSEYGKCLFLVSFCVSALNTFNQFYVWLKKDPRFPHHNQNDFQPALYITQKISALSYKTANIAYPKNLNWWQSRTSSYFAIFFIYAYYN